MTNVTALATREPTAAGLLPATMPEALSLAEHMARAKVTVPQYLHGNPGDCLAIIEQAMRWRLSPFMVAQKTHIVQGRLGYESQLIAAVIYANAPIQGRLEITYAGKDAGRTCTVKATVGGTVCAKTSPPIGQIPVKNSPLWKVDPDQQLAYWTQRAWARLYCPDVIMGVYAAEEIGAEAGHVGPDHAKEVNPVPQASTRPASRLDALATVIEQEAEAFDAATGEVGAEPEPQASPTEDPLDVDMMQPDAPDDADSLAPVIPVLLDPTGAPDWRGWLNRARDAVAEIEKRPPEERIDALERFLALHRETLENLRAVSAKTHGSLVQGIRRRIAECDPGRNINAG